MNKEKKKTFGKFEGKEIASNFRYIQLSELIER